MSSGPYGHQPLNAADAYRPGRRRRRRAPFPRREVLKLAELGRDAWKIDQAIGGEEIHIRPRGDLVWHPLEENCVCGPERTEALTSDGDLVPVIVHQALDGRE